METIYEGLEDAVALLLARDRGVLEAAALSLRVSFVAVVLAGAAGVVIGSVLARSSFPGRGLVVLLLRSGMAFPTVLVGLVLHGLLSRRGPLGSAELLYTPEAIIIGEVILALPIVATLTHGGVAGLDPRVAETARTLGAGILRRWRTYLSEARLVILLAVLTAFARCFTELGVAMMVGGNIRGHTRTLATAVALETGRGEFARGMAMGLILFSIGIAVMVATAWIGRAERDDAP